MKLNVIEKVGGLTKATFEERYLQPLLPVVFTDLTSEWPALERWTIQHFQSKYGDIQVPIYSNNIAKTRKGLMESEKNMPFGDYLDLIAKSEPCELRLFLFNLFKYAPDLKKDYAIPDIMDGFYKDFPFMFFGGKGSKVALHYDIDRSHVFLNQIFGKKRVVLFSPDQSDKIYHLPYTVSSYIDVNNPDYVKHPALKNVTGYEVILNPGETLFIPSDYWQYIEYFEGGYSINFRANESLTRRLKGALNLAKHYLIDKGMNKLMGRKWINVKQNIANKRAQKTLTEN